MSKEATPQPSHENAIDSADEKAARARRLSICYLLVAAAITVAGLSPYIAAQYGKAIGSTVFFVVFVSGFIVTRQIHRIRSGK